MSDAERLAAFREVARYLLDEFCIDDQVYRVRERAAETCPPEIENTWHHPDVVRFSAMVTRLRELAAP